MPFYWIYDLPNWLLGALTVLSSAIFLWLRPDDGAAMSRHKRSSARPSKLGEADAPRVKSSD